MLNFLTIIISILKYEASADGANRKLIVKNIRRQDVGEYVCKSGESAVTVKLTVGARGASGATLKGEYFLFRFGDFKHFNYIFSFIKIGKGLETVGRVNCGKRSLTCLFIVLTCTLK